MSFQYKIIKSTPEFDSMEVEFSQEGKEPIMVGVPLPKATDSLDAYLAQYVPSYLWDRQNAERMVVEADTTGTVGSSFVDEVVEEVAAEDNVRADRNTRLAVTDWTQLPDAQLTDEQKAAWATYRQALRDIPSQEGFPDSVTFPTAP